MTDIAGYRRGEHGLFYPIDSHGNVVGPVDSSGHPWLGMPVSSFPEDKFHFDPKTGIYTPVNAQGDYYVLDPDTGGKKYFDKNGVPTTGSAYNSGIDLNQPLFDPYNLLQGNWPREQESAYHSLSDTVRGNAEKYGAAADMSASDRDRVLNDFAGEAGTKLAEQLEIDRAVFDAHAISGQNMADRLGDAAYTIEQAKAEIASDVIRGTDVIYKVDERRHNPIGIGNPTKQYFWLIEEWRKTISERKAKYDNDMRTIGDQIEAGGTAKLR